MELEDVKKWFESEEGQKSASDAIEKWAKEDETEEIQLEKFHKRFTNSQLFADFVEKVKTKYNSSEYKDFWYSKGCEPPENLVWFLFSYTKKYGRECSEKEIEEYGNMFTSGMYYIDGYYFNRMDGQGSVIKILKKLEEDYQI